MTTIYHNAAEFVARGIAVFPVQYRGKRPSVPSWEVYKTTLPDDKQLRQWFPSNLRNYAVCLGWQNLAVLDFDDMDVWYEWQFWALDNCKLLDTAYRVKTSRGVHLYFRLEEEQHNLKLPGIDFKKCGYVVGPGSVHPSGHIYAALNDFNLPIVQTLASVLPAEIYEQAVRVDIPAPVEVPAAVLPAIGDIWEQAEQETMLDVLSPVDKIKRRHKLEHYFPGYKPDHSGYLHVKCPFHADDNPSAWVDVSRQLFGCHSCNFKPMSVIGFYAALHQVDIKTAIREMLK